MARMRERRSGTSMGAIELQPRRSSTSADRLGSPWRGIHCRMRVHAPKPLTKPLVLADQTSESDALSSAGSTDRHAKKHTTAVQTCSDEALRPPPWPIPAAVSRVRMSLAELERSTGLGDFVRTRLSFRAGSSDQSLDRGWAPHQVRPRGRRRPPPRGPPGPAPTDPQARHEGCSPRRCGGDGGGGGRCRVPAGARRPRPRGAPAGSIPGRSARCRAAERPPRPALRRRQGRDPHVEARRRERRPRPGRAQRRRGRRLELASARQRHVALDRVRLGGDHDRDRGTGAVPDGRPSRRDTNVEVDARHEADRPAAGRTAASASSTRRLIASPTSCSLR